MMLYSFVKLLFISDKLVVFGFQNSPPTPFIDFIYACVLQKRGKI